MTTSTAANASSPANISPVGPPPAITTACSVIAAPRRTSHPTATARSRRATARQRRSPAPSPPTPRPVRHFRSTHPPKAKHPFSQLLGPYVLAATDSPNEPLTARLGRLRQATSPG